MATLALLFIVVMALLNSVQSSSATINLLPDLMIDSEEFPVDQQFDSVRAFNESSYSNFRFIKMDPRMNLFINYFRSGDRLALHYMSQNQMSPYSFMEFQIGSIKLHVTEDSEGGYVCERVDSLYYENRARRWLQIYLTFLGQFEVPIHNGRGNMNYRLENKVEGLRLFANQQVLQEAIYMKSESFGTQLFNTNVYFEQIVPTESDWKIPSICDGLYSRPNN